MSTESHEEEIAANAFRRIIIKRIQYMSFDELAKLDNALRNIKRDTILRERSIQQARKDDPPNC